MWIPEKPANPSARSIAKRLLRALGESEVERIARTTGFLERQRKLSPLGLLAACIATLGGGKVQWLADILRTHNALTGASLQYKPFHNQLSKEQFPEFLRQVLESALDRLTSPALQAIPGHNLAQFDRILLHDGSSFALNAELAPEWPGRFTKISPAAVELHVTMDLLEGMPSSITLAPDKEAERPFSPSAQETAGCLLLEDRGYQSVRFFRDVSSDPGGGKFIIRGTKSIRPTILAARDPRGRRRAHLRYLEGKPLSWEILPRQSLDLEVEWSGSVNYRGRIVVFYKPGRRNQKQFTYLHTNLDHRRFSAHEVGLLYRLRWQVELLFKEWKSHANLHRFDTGKAPIAEGMIWAAILSATIKRGLAQVAELTLHVEISTDRVAKAGRHFLDEMMRCLLRGGRDLAGAIDRMLAFFDTNTRRAHPKRDRRTGRLAFGLCPFGDPSS